MGTMNILIADAVYQDRALLKEIIYQFDRHIKVDTVSNGYELFHRLASQPGRPLPDLLVLQYELPGAGALQVLEQIHLLEPCSTIVKVVWGALVSGEITERCRRWGATQCFSKLLQPSAMKRLVKDMLQTLTPIC